MKSFVYIQSRFLGMLAALLILAQSLFAVGLPAFYLKDYHPKKTEVKQIVASTANYLKVASRIHIATFLYYWVTHLTAIDIWALRYHNCKAFFVNAHSFNIYYTHLSALAP